MDNNELIQQARELCEKATPGPWYNFGDWMIHTEPDIEHNGIHNEKTIGTVRANNAAFIAASRTLIPQLCDALVAMTARAEKAKAGRDKAASDMKYYLDTNEDNGVVYIPKFAVEQMISALTTKGE